jgi:hypothetical protein
VQFDVDADAAEVIDHGVGYVRPLVATDGHTHGTILAT